MLSEGGRNPALQATALLSRWYMVADDFCLLAVCSGVTVLAAWCQCPSFSSRDTTELPDVGGTAIRRALQRAAKYFTAFLKGTPSIPETYLSSSVAWGLNLRVG